MAAAQSVNFARHQNLYKKKTPPWKETYRKRCLERLKKSRDDVFERFRRTSSTIASLVSEVMQEEWTALNLGPVFRYPMLKNEAEGVKPAVDEVSSSEIDYISDIVEEIKMELLNEEKQILKEYEAIMEIETEQIKAALSSEESSQVLCPICKKNFFVQSSNSVYCPCGISLQVEEGLNLTHLQQQLISGVSRHNCECQADPAFSVASAGGVSNLLITCCVCDFMFIVL